MKRPETQQQAWYWRVVVVIAITTGLYLWFNLSGTGVQGVGGWLEMLVIVLLLAYLFGTR